MFMSDLKMYIESLNDIYRKSFPLADEIDKDENRQDADIRLALMFIEYARTHNKSGKFDQVYDDEYLISECERILMYSGNSCYFEYRLTSYRNNMELLNMLQDALKLLQDHQEEISFRKIDGTFFDKIHDGHMAEIQRLDKEIEMLMAELDAKQAELSKFGFLSKWTIRKKDYTVLVKEIKGLQEQKEQLAAEIAVVEDEYRPYHASYYTYMQYLSCEHADKISRYFFSEHDEDFEKIYGISNQFKADQSWLKEKTEWIKNIIGADQNVYQRLQDMLKLAKINTVT